MKSIYELAVETNESDVLNELAERLYFMDYPDSQNLFHLNFDQAVSGYYYIREKGKSISVNNPNAEVIVFCEYISHRFYKEREDRCFAWLNKDKPYYCVDIIYPHRVRLDYILLRKNGRLKKNIEHALDRAIFEYIMATDVKYLMVPESTVRKYGEEKVLASFIAVAFRSLFMRSDRINTDFKRYHDNIPNNLSDFYYKKCKGLVDDLELKSMCYVEHKYMKNFSDDALNEIIHHPMMRKVEHDHGKM